MDVEEKQLRDINQISGLLHALETLSAKNDHILDEINTWAIKAYKKGE